MPEHRTIGDALIALIRTLVPLVVGSVLSLLTQIGFPEVASGELTVLLTAVFTAGYYALIRWLSTKWAWFGWLLGYPANPEYQPRHSE